MYMYYVYTHIEKKILIIFFFSYDRFFSKFSSVFKRFFGLFKRCAIL